MEEIKDVWKRNKKYKTYLWWFFFYDEFEKSIQ